jgi:hypothetical protein
MGGAYGKHGREDKTHENFSSENLKGRGMNIC